MSFLPHRGGYRNLRVYRITEVIYDVTFAFTSRFLCRGDRTVDQMIQAARSGKQNIAEGSKASSTSTETEIKLTNVAKASLEELLVDFEDYLRVRGLQQWGVDHQRYQKLREFCRSERLMSDYQPLLQKLNDEEMGNLAITLINQATYMLRRLIEKQQEMFLQHGGIREQMMHARLAYRGKNNQGPKYRPP
ncbi:MAG: four helix bundle suffix domain-containing protein [Muribaculaceae bacterium]|nr:four helix bundle suffix domain-containing protein [Muribaculaceae bacterium]